MSGPNSGAVDRPKREDRERQDRERRMELRRYVTGFAASVALTGGAFAALLSGLSGGAKLAVICGAALAQIVVHLRNFLHLNFSQKQSREDLLLVLFTVSLLAIMGGGTVWILTDLTGRMHGEATGAMREPATSTEGDGDGRPPPVRPSRPDQLSSGPIIFSGTTIRSNSASSI